MNVVVFAPDPIWGVPLLVVRALREAGHSVRALNGSVFQGRNLGYRDLDCVFSFGARHSYADVIKAAKNDFVPFFVLDLSPIRRKDYFQVGEMGLNNFPDLGRPERTPLSDLIRAIRPAPDPEGPILYLGQKPDDAQHGMNSRAMRGYASQRASQIHELLSGLKIYWKSHPMDENPTEIPVGFEALPTNLVGAPIPEVVKQLKPRAVATYNSTGAFEALLGRYPVFCDESAFYSELAATDVTAMVEPESAVVSLAKLKNFLARMSWGLWSEEELATGQFAVHIEERVEALKEILLGPKEQVQAKKEAQITQTMKDAVAQRRAGRGGPVRAIYLR